MTGAQHTKERLVVTTQDDQVTGCANFESRSGIDAIVLYHDNAKADARRIVQCWNAHDELVATLQWITENGPDDAYELRLRAHEALAKAGAA
jgi:hypothetical protein